MYIVDQLKSEIKEQWNNDLLGELKQVDIKILKSINRSKDEKVEKSAITLLLSSLSAAISTCRVIGQGKEVSAVTLKSIKSRMDTSASYAFNDFRKSKYDHFSVSVSEGKDERGHIVDDPLKQIEYQEESELNVAVDVIDGTTLAAKGLDGAYSISAGSKGLKPFPDMQAYTIGGPVDVLEHVDFSRDPEEEVLNFLSLLAQYYQKPINQLKIVTHSHDTGMHHNQIIEIMEQLGVTVIVPDPVIVEPPYVATMALELQGASDGIIGVFGLPEIVINALLCINITDKKEIRFRVASNSMLSKPESTDLKERFSFTQEENQVLDDYKIDIDHVYGKEDLAENYDNACFTAIALTNDPVLEFSGITKNGNIISVEALFATKGITMKINTLHSINHPISYIARHSQKIDDISIIVPICNTSTRQYLNGVLAKMKAENFDFLKYSEEQKLHVTLYEYGIHYGGYSGELQQVETQLTHFFSKNSCIKLTLNIGNVGILGDSIVCNVNMELNSQELAALKPVYEKSLLKFVNIDAIPVNLHITLARFVTYTEQCRLDHLNSFLKNLPLPTPEEQRIIGNPQLVHIGMTPYNNIRTLASN